MNKPAKDKTKIFNLTDSVLFDNLPIGLITVDNNTHLINANDYMFEIFNKAPIDVKSMKFGNVFECSVVADTNELCGTPDRCNNCDLRNGVINVLHTGHPLSSVEFSHEFKLNGRNTKKWFSISASRYENDNEKFALVAFTDISELKTVQQELITLGITDELTGLFNRRHMMVKLKELVTGKDSDAFPLTLAMIDIDNFKSINDTYGHLTGDAVLSGLSSLFRRESRSTDVIGRYGGDEFIAIFTNSDIKDSKVFLQRISNSFSNLMSNTIETPLSISCGLISINKSIKEDLILSYVNKADRLLLKAKAMGRDRILT